MPRPDPLYRWADRVASRFPTLSRCQARVLAWYSFGMVAARSGGLDRVSVHLAALSGVAVGTVRQRLREFYRPAHSKRGRRRRELTPEVCFGPLLAWVLSGWGDGPLALAIDPTSLGDRLTVLCVSAVYRGCAVPVAWAVLPANQPGAWNPHWIRLLGLLREQVGPDRRVFVLSDRGIESSELFRAIVALGWSPLMRAKARGCFRPEGGDWTPMPELAPRHGARFRARGQAFKEKSARLDCTLLARWDAGHADPWLILTDLPPDEADAAWYSLRTWIECSFKKIKSDGWQWQKTRMTDPQRAARLWAAMALATLWTLELGGQIDAARRPESPSPAGPKPRRWSTFLLGGAAILAAWITGADPSGRFHPQPWPAPERDAAPPHEALMKID
uniref:transposase n=1 Tax=Paludisphaera rhizosphaerae TaxID=2711216 RepID=UPI0013EC277C